MGQITQQEAHNQQVDRTQDEPVQFIFAFDETTPAETSRQKCSLAHEKNAEDDSRRQSLTEPPAVGGRDQHKCEKNEKRSIGTLGEGGQYGNPNQIRGMQRNLES